MLNPKPKCMKFQLSHSIMKNFSPSRAQFIRWELMKVIIVVAIIGEFCKYIAVAGLLYCINFARLLPVFRRKLHKFNEFAYFYESTMNLFKQFTTVHNVWLHFFVILCALHTFCHRHCILCKIHKE